MITFEQKQAAITSEAVRKIAIEFAEWISESEWESDGFGGWSNGNQEATTEYLYSIFKFT